MGHMELKWRHLILKESFKNVPTWVWELLNIIDVFVAQRGFLKFEFWFSGLVNWWNLAHWNHRRRNPIFDHEKPFLTIKRAHLTILSHFQTTKCPQFVIFDCDRVILNDSNWFKPNPNLESENQNSPKSKLTRFSTHLIYPFVSFWCTFRIFGN